MTHFRHLRLSTVLIIPLGLWQTGCQAQTPSFSEAQATAGQTAYNENCADCHGENLEGVDIAPALAGNTFDQKWRGKSADILSFHLRRMPPESVAEPGSLSEETHANILAYILKSNDFPAGDVELPADMVGLAAVKIPRLEGVDYDPDKPVVATGEQQERLANLSSVTDKMLRSPPASDWLGWGRTQDGQNYSPLDGINKQNVADLMPARAPLRGGNSMPTPLVHDGIMFLHTFPDTVLAMDATNGDVLWRHQYEPKSGSSQKMGLGIHGDTLLVPTSDLHVLALNAKTGDLKWDHAINTPSKGPTRGGYQLRSAPLIVGNKVIQGVSASFVPKGGFIVAVYLDSGEEAWRFNTIARPDEPFGNTWSGLPLDKRSGGSVWHQGTYDPELNLIYFGVAPTYDTGPLLKPSAIEGHNNDAKYTNCTVALNADSGELVWHYQHCPNDQWDLDWVFERQIVTVPFGGVQRKVVMNVGKTAILEAVDAATGEYLFSVDTGIQNVVTHIDPKTGEKTIDPEKMPDVSRPCVVCPSAFGARSWPPTSYSPATNLVYVPLTDSCMTLGKGGMPLLTSGVGISMTQHPDSEDGTFGRLQAIDVANQKLAWTVNQATPISTGLLATAGGLVFSGDIEPSVKAFDDQSGELLWEAALDDAPSSSIMTYSVDDRQFVALVVGMTNFHINGLQSSYRQFASNKDVPAAPKGGAAIWVFALE